MQIKVTPVRLFLNFVEKGVFYKVAQSSHKLLSSTLSQRFIICVHNHYVISVYRVMNLYVQRKKAVFHMCIVIIFILPVKYSPFWHGEYCYMMRNAT